MGASNIGPGYTAEAVRAILREEAKYQGSQRALSRLIGCSAAFLNDIILGKREPAGKVLKFLGLRRVVTYRGDGENHRSSTGIRHGDKRSSE